MKVGRTEWSDFSLPRDAKLAEVHFALDCGYGICRIRNLDKKLETLVNDKPISEGDVRHGDRIAAGDSVFLLSIEEAASIIAPPSSDEAKATPSGFLSIDDPVLASDVCKIVQLDPPAIAMLQTKTNIKKFFDNLVVGNLTADAIRFLAHALSRRQAVWWSCQCVRSAMGEKILPKDQAAILAAAAWVVDPNDATRRAAIEPAEATNFSTPAGWCAGAAFWSGGSITAHGMPVVLPKPTLSAEAAVLAIELAAVVDPKQVAARTQAFLKIGSDVADGLNRWPAKQESPA